MHLPIHNYKDEFMRLLRAHQVISLVGPTGCGKTTYGAIFAREAGFGANGKKIGVTEPRRLPTTQVATFVARQCGNDCGEEVGYQIRHDNMTSDWTNIKFMTEGILLCEMLSDPDLSEYEVIMVDEAHEASTNQIIILGMLRSILARRPDLKLIIASATIDAARYSKHFGDAPILEIEGSVHDVEIIYDPVPHGKAYTHKIASLVRKIHHNRDDGDILAFLTGEDDIGYVADLIDDMNLSVVVCPLYSQLSPAEQAFALASHSKRKIILATNIAETGITPKGIKFVIDTGLIKQHFFDPLTGFSILEVVKHSQSGCKQRTGRTGRLTKGKCYRLYSEKDFLARPEYSTSEITRDPADSMVLYMIGMGIKDPEKFPLLECPDKEHLHAAYEHLKSLGALTCNNALTTLGKKMLALPVDPHQARQVLAGIDNGCAEAVITIVSMVSTGKSPFIRPVFSDKFEAAASLIARKKFVNEKSDHLTLLNVYTKWQEAGGTLLPEKWYEDNWLNPIVLAKAEKIIDQIKRILGKSYKKGLVDPLAIRKSIAIGLTRYICKKSHAGHMNHMKTNTHVSLHKRSDLANTVHMMVAEELITDSRNGEKVKACICTEVDPQWLPVKFEKNHKKRKRF